jgi:release factor glutamine methyltransferase
MTIKKWLQKSIADLESASIPTAKLDAEVLLADFLHRDRSWLHAHPDFILPASVGSDPEKQGRTLKELNEFIKRRMNHEPIAYIRGKQEFYGRDFFVSPDTLTPRPETETMIDLMIKTVKKMKINDINSIKIIDVGTGSGCIIITAALELPEISNMISKTSYVGLDISEEALAIAKRNSKSLNSNVKFKKFDLISDNFSIYMKQGASNIILANLPYVPNNFHINLAASHEPGFAIFGGKDGLDYYRLLFKKVTKQTGLILTESLPPQHTELIKIAKEAGYDLVANQDLIHVFTK